MQHQDDKKTNSRLEATASSAVSDSTQKEPSLPQHSHSGRTLKHKQILNGNDICSRFDHICGKGLPKRMTTGKFVYLGPTDKTPESPL